VKARTPVSLAALFFFAGCSFFPRQPPLPRQAAVQPNGDEETFTNLIQGADIIYFPIESTVLLPRSSAAWRLLEALKHNGGSFALGWDTAAGDEKVRRALSNEADKSGAQLLALHVPPELVPTEMHLEFVPPPEDFERFARRFSHRGLKEGALRAEYEAGLMRRQLAAEMIAAYFKEHRNEKMLIFLRRDEVRDDYGVPYFVAQKTKARQLVLNPQQAPAPRSRLLAGN
jgi:hypothetical protein